ncbi:hypothetical protein T4B_15178 [Trichinella pseudospiralis]|uniref:Uncharacterized protein n=2 Tax=Trichinella pseudospiralis TaxID=6337 RepID=A0A0V1IPV1_TRIPS|nr:hypothetical protein T4D_12875 [Trichinella pseudospiralis]KRZ24213.1 hypothetical protein T4B_15178 [Trichinella pseudospiralis]
MTDKNAAKLAKETNKLSINDASDRSTKPAAEEQTAESSRCEKRVLQTFANPEFSNFSQQLA